MENKKKGRKEETQISAVKTPEPEPKPSFFSARFFRDKRSSVQHTEVVWMNSDKCRSHCEGRSDRKGDEKRTGALSQALSLSRRI